MDYRIPMMELLVTHGADVNAVWNGNYPIILAPCETLAVESLRWLPRARGQIPTTSPQYGNPLTMLVGTYSRDAARVGTSLPPRPRRRGDRELPDNAGHGSASGTASTCWKRIYSATRNFSTRTIIRSSEIFPPELEA